MLFLDKSKIQFKNYFHVPVFGVCKTIETPVTTHGNHHD